MNDKGRLADHAVAEQAARTTAEIGAERARQTEKRKASLEPLRSSIRAEIPRALARLQSVGFAGGRMVRVNRPRLIGKQYEEKAAWELETHNVLYKGEMLPRTTWLLSDGRLLAGALWRDTLTDETDESVLKEIMNGLLDLGTHKPGKNP
jgi:hypothetical protein